MNMKKFLIAILIGAAAATDVSACGPELPTHNSYVFSVFRRESMSSPFREDMNAWWKRYAGEPESDAYDYYGMYADKIRAKAESLGDSQMLDYMHWLDGYLEVCRDLSTDSWTYPTKEELAARDSMLHLILSKAQAYKGRKMRAQYALLTMRANMLLGRDKANMLYWTATASKLPRGVYRDVARNIYARALFNSGLRRQACDIYAEQGDMGSIRYCMRNYRNMAGIRKIYSEDPSAPSLLYLVQDVVNNLQETLDAAAAPYGTFTAIGSLDTRKVQSDEALAFVALADSVLADGKTDVPCLWQSAAAMVKYLLGDGAEAHRRIDEAMEMRGSGRMKDNARSIRLLVAAANEPLGGETSAWLTREFKWLDGKIADERAEADAWTAGSGEYANHYTDVKERVVYGVLVPRYTSMGMNSMATALFGMMEENEQMFSTDNRHGDDDFVWGGSNLDYNSWWAANEYFSRLSVMPADSVAAYYSYLTSAKTDVFEHYVAGQVYLNKDYYNDLIGTRYLAEGRMDEALEYLERVPLGYLRKQNISWYMANRDYNVERWFRRQLPNEPSTDGVGLGSPAENLKVRFCKDLSRLADAYRMAPEGTARDSMAYALAVMSYQASCYGDCWFLTHYGHSVNDSARAGEYDFAAAAVRYLTESAKSADLKLRYKSLYALASMSYDPWVTYTYDKDYNEIAVPRAGSGQYKALAELSRFAAANPQVVDSYTTKCDVLKMFRKLETD